MFAMSGLAPIIALGDALWWTWVLRADAACRCLVEDAASRGSLELRDQLSDQAMRVLHDGSADAGLRDWAERYLCRMTDKAPGEFMEGRRVRR